MLGFTTKWSFIVTSLRIQTANPKYYYKEFLSYCELCPNCIAATAYRQAKKWNAVSTNNIGIVTLIIDMIKIKIILIGLFNINQNKQ